MIWICFALAAATPSAVTSSSPPAAVAVALTPQHPAVRSALRAGDGAAALRALAAEGVTAAVAPGLYAHALRLDDKATQACAVELASSGGAAATVAQARCLIEGGKPSQALPLLANVPAEAVVLIVADDVVLTAIESSKSERVLAAALEMPIPAFDARARARMARVMAALKNVDDKTISERARQRLVEELPDQPEGAAALAAMSDLGKTAALRVRRAAVLERLQKNAEVVALVGDLVTSDCEAALLVGKAERKLRHYQSARVALQKASSSACGEVAKKARYLEVKVATIQKGANAEKTALAFIESYGADPLVDDVLLWLAEIRGARGDADGERTTLERLISEHPAGDMVDEARLRLAMRLAAADDVDGARNVLAAAVRSLTLANKKPVELDRARYWHARLAYAPSLTSWAKGPAVEEGTRLLTVFARERPAGFYGRLAAQVLGIEPTTLPRGALAADAAVDVPATLRNQRQWIEAGLAVQAGYDDEAALLLAAIEGVRDVESAMAIAAMFVSVDRPDLAHRSLRDRGFALIDGAPTTPAALARWSLGWPRAWATELTTAATEFKVPPALLIGLSREESAFDAGVVSWAGATGLCQLMPPTAKDEAKSMKLPPPTAADLVDPAYNARLGASHLGRRLKSMRHPFMAIAAYNAGPGSVAKWMPAAGASVPIDTWVEAIPFDETRNYVKKVTGSWTTYTLLDGGAPVSFPLTITGR